MMRPILILCLAASMACGAAQAQPAGAPAVAQHWDERSTNGYWNHGRWTYGPPPADLYGQPGVRVGYKPWVRGGLLPLYYQSFVVTNYASYHLRRPPVGYHWAQAGQDYLLIADATWRIFDIVPIR